jgi:adenylate kinase family enzyme
MKIWKLSLGKNYFNDNSINTLRNNNIVSIHPNTGKDQGISFLNVSKGDMFYVCRSNETIELIGMFIDSRPLHSIINEQNDWAAREYVLVENAINKNKYNKDLNKGWSPRYNSTFFEVPKNEYPSFEKEILQPVFGKTLKEILKKRRSRFVKLKLKLNDFCDLQSEFAQMQNDSNFIFDKINSLNKIELKKLDYEYKQRKDITKQPVVWLRSSIVEKLLQDVKIDKKVISELKKDITENFEKNVFKAWTSSFRVLYQLIFAQYKENTETYFHKLMDNVRIRLDIKDVTKTNLVHFDGAQNQGYDEIWFAIYNKTHKSQKHAYQLYFSIKNGIRYGLNHMDIRTKGEIISSKSIKYKELIELYSSVKEKIINDNSMEKAMITDFVDILKEQKQIILQGPPGTGKTRLSKQISHFIINGETEPFISDLKNNIKLIQFHPSYNYEDFVRGIIAITNKNNQVEYKVENKTLAQFAERAKNDKNQPYILIIDEINRADLSSVLGELIYALEYRDEPVESMYEKDGSRELTLPSNLYIIGTMNTADRSIGHIDYAIRRRFVFCDVLSDKNILDNYPRGKILFEIIEQIFTKDFISPEFEISDIMIGHSYFITNIDNDENIDELTKKFIYQVLPLIKEYFKDGIFHSKPEIRLGDKYFDLSNKVMLTTDDIKEFLK